VIEQKDKYQLSLRKRMKMVKEAALGINWLHCSSPMFIHRDLKPSNLLVTEDFHVKVADFGLTKMKDKTSNNQNNTPQGSPAYMAPEVFLGEYDEKCDVYSFGIVLWECVQQERVFKEYQSLPALMHAVIDKKVRPEIAKNFSTRLRKLMESCWDNDAKNRPTMTKVIKELEMVILDVTLQDHSARDMWRKKLNGENEVPWSKFARIVCEELNLKFEEKFSSYDDYHTLPLDLQCLHEIVVQKQKKSRKVKHKKATNQSIVKVKLFGAMVQCFGPFDKDFLKRVKILICSKWFHGNISQEIAEDVIRKTDSVGAFLVRFSSAPGCFTLSVQGKKQVEHHRIINVPGHACYVWSAQYEDIFEVISDGKDKKLIKKPCSGSPYEHLSEKKKKKAPPVGSSYTIPNAQAILNSQLKTKTDVDK